MLYSTGQQWINPDYIVEMVPRWGGDNDSELVGLWMVMATPDPLDINDKRGYTITLEREEAEYFLNEIDHIIQESM